MILAKAERKRRHRQTVLLDKVDIPSSSIEIVEDEVLGLGGFGTVFLADLAGGLNAAAKVVTFPHGSAGHGCDDDDAGSRADDSDGEDNDDVEYDASIDTGCNNSVNDGNISSSSAPVPTFVHDNRSPSMAGDRAVNLLPQLRIVGPSDQKARRRAVVAKAKRSAALARAEARQRQALCQELEYMKRLRGPRTVHTYGGVTALARDRVRMYVIYGFEILMGCSGSVRPYIESTRINPLPWSISLVAPPPVSWANFLLSAIEVRHENRNVDTFPVDHLPYLLLLSWFVGPPLFDTSLRVVLTIAVCLRIHTELGGKPNVHEESKPSLTL